MRFPLPAIRCTLRPAHLLWRQLVVRLSSQHTTAISTPLHSRCLLFLSGSLHRCTFSEDRHLSGDSTRDIHKRQRRGSVSSLPGCGPKRSPLARIWPHQVPLQLAAGPHAPNDEQLIRVCEPGLTRLATCGPTETFCNLIRRMGDNFRDARVCFDGQRLDGSERILSCIDPDIGGFPLVDLFLEQTGGGGNSPEVKRLKADVKRLKADVKRLKVEMELLKGARSTAFAAAAVPGAGPSEISAAFATASTAVVSAAAAAAAAAPSSTAVVSAASSSTTSGSASASASASTAASAMRDALMATSTTDFYMYKGQAVTWDDVHGAEMARRAVGLNRQDTMKSPAEIRKAAGVGADGRVRTPDSSQKSTPRKRAGSPGQAKKEIEQQKVTIQQKLEIQALREELAKLKIYANTATNEGTNGGNANNNNNVGSTNGGGGNGKLSSGGAGMATNSNEEFARDRRVTTKGAQEKTLQVVGDDAGGKRRSSRAEPF